MVMSIAQELKVKCEVCSKEVSKNAKSCPNCGEPSTPGKLSQIGYKTIGFGFTVLFFGLLVLSLFAVFKILF